MAFDLPGPSEWINWPLLKEPLNWAIVGVIASIWLLLIHVIMTAFGAMSGTQTGQAIGGGGPGSIAAPLAAAPSWFSAAGNTGGGYTGDSTARDTSTNWFGSDNIWTDDFEAKYAEDGWIGN